MLALIPAFVALSAALSVSAHPLRSVNVLARHHAVDIALRADGDRYADPEGWFTGYLEDYTTYHKRYLAIDCDDKHNTDFFDKCCHPMLATETLEKNRAPECNPANHSSSSNDTGSDDSDNDDDYDECEDSDYSDDSSDSGNTQHATTTAAPAAATPTAKAKVATPSSSKKEEEAPKSTKEESKTTSSEAPKETKNNDSSNNDSSNNGSSDNNGSGNVDYKNTGIVTWYFQGGNKGACGESHSDDDLIAAMNSKQYNSLNVCGKSVMIHANNGKSVKVKVVDECPGCDEGSIDLSRGAFAQLGNFDLGTIDMSWNFV